jgi:hypothetical protein
MDEIIIPYSEKLKKNNFSEKLKNEIENSDGISEEKYEENSNSVIEWTIEKELLLVEWGDIAKSYKWLNAKSHKKYSYMHKWFTIPTIILSTLTGTASFAQGGLSMSTQDNARYVIGSVTIFIGILTTIREYLKVAELKENYRISTIHWDKYARNIRIELSKPPIERMSAENFIKLARKEFDHLMETTPPISEKIIRKFKERYMGLEESPQRKKYDILIKPDILEDMISSNNNYRHNWYDNSNNV